MVSETRNRQTNKPPDQPHQKAVDYEIGQLAPKMRLFLNHLMIIKNKHWTNFNYLQRNLLFALQPGSDRIIFELKIKPIENMSRLFFLVIDIYLIYCIMVILSVILGITSIIFSKER